MRAIEIYTDGACSGNPGPGGWASVVSLENETITICGFDEDTTNNRMELKAFISGLEMALNSADEKPGTPIIIRTDSKYVENPINCNWIKKWETNNFDKIKNVDLWVQVIELLKKVTVKVEWIERAKNKVADAAARNARDGLYGMRATIID